MITRARLSVCTSEKICKHVCMYMIVHVSMCVSVYVYACMYEYVCR